MLEGRRNPRRAAAVARVGESSERRINEVAAASASPLDESLSSRAPVPVRLALRRTMSTSSPAKDGLARR